MPRTDTRSPRRALLLAGALLAAGAAAARGQESYGFVRTLEGAAALLDGGGERSDLEVNAPVLVGDRLWVARSSRLEIALPDRNLLRLDSATEVGLERLAYSADGDERLTHLRLERGELQLVVVEDALGERLPRVDTANATLYVEAPGSFLVTTDGERWTEVVARRGSLEVVTPRGTQRVRAGQRLEVAGADRPQVALRAAGPEASLERWGRALDAEIAAAELDDLGPELRYGARGLDQGDWIDVEGRRAWRPQVGAGWRPYSDGYWIPTAAGLTWVSYEPWGWTTYHYGSWDHVPGWGWVWYPGRVFAPAWVYWYWGPSYIGWCPTGYYSGFYARAHHGYRPGGLRWGVHGWAGGPWDAFADWTFCPTSHFWRRGLRAHAWSGRDLRHRSRLDVVPRGVITTDTRGLRPGLEGRPLDAVEAVRRARDSRPGGARGATAQLPDKLPDVTAFVARRRELPPEVTRTVLVDAPGAAGGRDLRLDGESPAAAARPRVRPDAPAAPAAIPPIRPIRPIRDGGSAARDQSWREGASPRRLPERPGAGAAGEGSGRVSVRPRPTPPAASDESWRDAGRPARVPPATARAGDDGAARRPAAPTGESWRDAGPPPRRSTAPAPAREPAPAAGAPRPPVVRRVVEGILDGQARSAPTRRPTPGAERPAPPSPAGAAASSPPPRRDPAPAAGAQQRGARGSESRGAESRGSERRGSERGGARPRSDRPPG